MAALSLEDEGDRNDHPGGDGLARLFGRGEAPFAHCRQRGLVEPRVAARFGELQFLDRAFGADQHLDGDGALPAKPARSDRIARRGNVEINGVEIGRDWNRVVWGKSVTELLDIGGCRLIKKKKNNN